MTSGVLPIDALRPRFEAALARGPVVVSAPTGSGKSTQVPRWCRERGPVLVVEPRRVACRSLAEHVARLEGSKLGELVGYSVRDDHRAGPQTGILYATTGIVLRMLAGDGIERFDTVILDELHERSLEVDLILALLVDRQQAGLVAMSATLDAEAVARHLEGEHLRAEGRLFPVDVRHLPGETLLPDSRGLEEHVAAALGQAREDAGDVLVFLPGKGEIASVSSALSARDGLDILPLHGGLSLTEQTRAFAPAGPGRRKVVLATNVAETSVTLPGIGVVIDSGLVRRTRYHLGRSYLSLAPIAQDSAEQRAGRAGRTGPGVCYRLWSEAALLEGATPPAVHREALAPLLLAAAACEADVGDLPFLDPPKDYALSSAREDLLALDAIDASGSLTERGRRLFGLPVDPALGRLLVEAEATGCLPDVVDLVAVLAAGRPLFVGARRPEDDEEDDPRASGCDALARIRILRGASRRRGVVNEHALGEARAIADRLRAAFGLGERLGPEVPVDRALLARTAIAADARCVHVARKRRGKVAWSNGGTEAELGRESAVDPMSRKPVEAVAVLEARAIGAGQRKTKVIIACAVPLHVRWIVEAGVGHDRLCVPIFRRGQIIARVERVYARRVLETREEAPLGRLAREALRDLFVAGRIFAEALEPARDRLSAWALVSRLRRRSPSEVEALLPDGDSQSTDLPESLAEWALHRLEELGFEGGDDLALLSPDDFLPPELPAPLQSWLDRVYPRRLLVGDVAYDVTYDLRRREVVLEAPASGKRRPPPPISYLPPFAGFRIVVRDRGSSRVLRE